jgi:GT2 family glycosyltransferase
MNTAIAIILIGRNEGDRLKRALDSVIGLVDRIVYVDSGSTDHSVLYAQSKGIEVVELDMSIPFTAARARNAGVDALRDQGLPDYLQFIDGDCALVRDWLSMALSVMRADTRLGIVTGWRREIHPDASIYNAMCDHEWYRPAGPIVACGGDMLVRSEAFEAAGGFNPSVIAAEDDEFCLRVRMAGYKLLRIPRNMTAHDADMHRFSQWWKRSVRNGHGFAQLGALHGSHLSRERARVYVFGLMLPAVALAGLMTNMWVLAGVLALYAGSYASALRGLLRDGISPRVAWRFAGFLTLSKIPNLFGMATFALRRLRGRSMQIIEYK